MKSDLSNLTILKIVRAARVKLGKVSHSKVRTNNVIYFKLTGKTFYTVNGKRYLSDAKHIVFLPRGCEYICSVEETGECINIDFDIAENMLDLPMEPLCYEVANPTEIHNIASRLEMNFIFNRPDSHNKCLSDLYKLFYMLEAQTKRNYSMDSKFKKIKKSIDYLESNYSDSNLTCKRLASCSGISEVYFRRIFTSLYKCSPMQYLQIIRIQKAKALLEGNYGQVQQIAGEVGYNNGYNFCRAFKRIVGCSPTEYANKL